MAWLDEVEPRGEYVLVVGGKPAASDVVPSDAEVEAALAGRLAAGDDRKAAVAEVASALGVPKREVYDLAVRLRRSAESG
jgi:16S rRNA (cytidine1402-2'-O)-methyltransferase